MYGLTMVADVFAPNQTDGAYDQLVLSGLPCRLTLVSPEDGKDTHDRAELAAMRRLLWGPETALAENVRFAINGENWSPIAGSFALVTGLAAAPVYRRCELVRAV